MIAIGIIIALLGIGALLDIETPSIIGVIMIGVGVSLCFA